jgi:anti-sigma B factor antagonist
LLLPVTAENKLPQQEQNTMQLEHQNQDHVDIVRLPERLMMADASAARSQLQKILKKNKPMLAIDLTDLEYIDSSGLAVLVNCLQQARKRSGEVCLFGMCETVKVLFELTRLYDLFPVAVARNDAVRNLSS